MPQFDVPTVSSATPAPTSANPTPSVATDPTLADIMGSGSPGTGTTEAPADDKGVQELGQFFGIEGTDPAATKAALKPVLEMMAQNGDVPQQPQPQQYANYQSPQQQQAPPPQEPDLSEVSFDDLDLGEDASPQIIKAFKAMGERSQKAIKAAISQSAAAQAAVAATSKQFQQQQYDTEQAAQNEVTTRAVSYIDNLASPKYGVGNNRTLVQTLASQVVMTKAGNLIRGMKAYGQVLPIEQVMGAAILMVEGELPQAPAQSVPGTAALNPSTPKGPAPVPKRTVGSAGAGQQLMGDPEFLDGARAILAR